MGSYQTRYGLLLIIGLGLGTNGCSKDALGNLWGSDDITEVGEGGSCDGHGDCEVGLGCCGSTCTDLQDSNAHCGGCNRPCESGTSCVDGACLDDAIPRCEAHSDCEVGLACCDGLCVDTSASNDHCGACGSVCEVGQGTGQCFNRVCTVVSCEPGFADCDVSDNLDCEQDILGSDPSHCGGCYEDCSGAGQECFEGQCIEDCRFYEEHSCPTDQVCNYNSGECVDPNSDCLGTGAFVPCGEYECGPGTVCDALSGGEPQCVAHTACTEIFCHAGKGICWGENCPCERPAPVCTPASPGTSFLSGAIGFDIDDACNMYAVTTLSGTDYLRRLAPDGTLTQWASVANLNMGEVAAQRRYGDWYGGEEPSEIAYTYACCPTCGCSSSPPQGLGHLSDGTLPLLIAATQTSSDTPLPSNKNNVGPFGLSISAVNDFYVGNIHENGEYYRWDIQSASEEEIAFLPDRVLASTPFDAGAMLVAIRGGDIYWVDIFAVQDPRVVGNLGSDMVSLKRDPFSGRFYASLRDLSIVSFTVDNIIRDVQEFATVTKASRIAIAPNGLLYAMGVTAGPVVNFPLPTER